MDTRSAYRMERVVGPARAGLAVAVALAFLVVLGEAVTRYASLDSLTSGRVPGLPFWQEVTFVLSPFNIYVVLGVVVALAVALIARGLDVLEPGLHGSEVALSLAAILVGLGSLGEAFGVADTLLNRGAANRILGEELSGLGKAGAWIGASALAAGGILAIVLSLALLRRPAPTRAPAAPVPPPVPPPGVPRGAPPPNVPDPFASRAAPPRAPAPPPWAPLDERREHGDPPPTPPGRPTSG